MTDLPKLPGGWVWSDEPIYIDILGASPFWVAFAKRPETYESLKARRTTRAEAIARVAAMVEAVVGSEVKRD